MKSNSMSLDQALTKELGECEVGDTKQVLLTVTVDSKDDTGFSATVTGVEPYDMAEETEEPMEEIAPTGNGPKALRDAIES